MKRPVRGIMEARRKPWETLLGKEVRALRLISYSRGRGLTEYAIILALVSIIVVAILFLLGPAIGSIFARIAKVF